MATSYDAARESETCLDQTVTQEPPSRQSLCHTKIFLASSSPPKLSTFQQYPCVACPQLWLYLHPPLTATCTSQSHFRHSNNISSSLDRYLVFAVPAFSEPSKHYNCTWPRPSSACASCPDHRLPFFLKLSLLVSMIVPSRTRSYCLPITMQLLPQETLVGPIRGKGFRRP